MILLFNLSNLLAYWWALPLALAIIFYRATIRLVGIVIIPEDKIGLVNKKFVLFGGNRTLKTGRIVATNGEAGFQAETLAPGIHFFKWIWQYHVKLQAFTVINSGQIGVVYAKDGNPLDQGRILAKKVDCNNFQDAVAFLTNGQRGRQAAILTPGNYRINTLLFSVETAGAIKIDNDTVGIVTTLDGEPLATGQIAGSVIEGHKSFQDADFFMAAHGQKGRQEQVILAGTYYINPFFATIEPVKMTEIPIGYVGVVISFVGEEGVDTSGKEFEHANIVDKGKKGIWNEAFSPGKYAINTYTTKVELVPTTNLVLNWASGRTEAHELDKALSTITVRSQDGYTFNLDVSQIIHIAAVEAPKVISRFGTMKNLVSQVLEPTIGNYFRNSAQKSDVMSFLGNRSDRQKEAKEHIAEVLKEYDVKAVDTLIGDINPPAELMKTLTDRKLAEQQKLTFDTQKQAQITKKDLENATAEAETQKNVVAAEREVIVAEKHADAVVKKATGDASAVKVAAAAESERLSVVAGGQAKATKLKADAEAEFTQKTGLAEAEVIQKKGEATAKSYELQAKAMGQGVFGQLKIVEQIAAGKLKIVPDVLINSGGGGGTGSSNLENLVGLSVLERLPKIFSNGAAPAATNP